MTGASGSPPTPPSTPPPGEPPPPPPPGRPLAAMPPPAPAHRPVLDLGAAFRFGWATFRANPGPLVGAVVVSYGLMVVLGVGGVGLGMWLTSLDPVPVPLVVALVVVGWIAFVVAAQLPTIWMLRAGVDAVEGRRITFGRIVELAGTGPLLAAVGLVMAGVLLGYVLLVIPGVVFAVMSSFTLHHVIDAGEPPTDAIRASIALFRRHPGPALGLVFVTGLAASLGVYACGVGIVVSIPVSLLAQVHGFRQLSGGPVPVA